MKKILGFLALSATLALSGCASTQSAQDSLVVACTTYSSAFAAALALREHGKLNTPQIKAITELDAQVFPLCNGPLPTDQAVAAAQVTQAITNLATEVALQKASK